MLKLLLHLLFVKSQVPELAHVHCHSLFSAADGPATAAGAEAMGHALLNAAKKAHTLQQMQQAQQAQHGHAAAAGEEALTEDAPYPGWSNFRNLFTAKKK